MRPFDGKVDVMFETGHAAGLVSEEGVELLVHVGVDTVNLEGKYFYPKKKSGDTIKKGEVILEFDKEKIAEAGYDITTPVIVSNSERYARITPVQNGKVQELAPILEIV